jgi:uncharacterized membrane protein YfcA
VEFAAIFALAIVAGVLGSMLGVGGGVMIVPVLTLLFGVPIKVAIGASLLCVIATSSAAQTIFLTRGLTHVRLGMTLEMATTIGALAGGVTAVLISGRVLQGLFGGVLLYTIYGMSRQRDDAVVSSTGGLLDGSYVDPGSGVAVAYGVRRFWPGMGMSFVAGNVSGLLGIGGGAFKVPIMSAVMGMPLKAAIATSNFMIGVTAATSALIYYGRGYLDAHYAVPAALGVLLGARFGPGLATRLPTRVLRYLFESLLLVFAGLMIAKAAGV